MKMHEYLINVAKCNEKLAELVEEYDVEFLGNEIFIGEANDSINIGDVTIHHDNAISFNTLREILELHALKKESIDAFNTVSHWDGNYKVLTISSSDNCFLGDSVIEYYENFTVAFNGIYLDVLEEIELNDLEEKCFNKGE